VVNRLHPDFRGGDAGLGPASEAGDGAGGDLPAGEAGDPGGADGDSGAAAGDSGGAAGDSGGAAGDSGGAAGGKLTRSAAVAALAGMRQNLDDLQVLADRERGYLATLESRIDGAVVKVPYLPRDVHDLDGLALVAECLTGQVLSGRA
jgi:hypothetical protein